MRLSLSLTVSVRNCATRQGAQTLRLLVNKSVTQTLTRSIYTNLTTFIMVAVLYILGVSSIREFALPLMVGIVCGSLFLCMYHGSPVVCNEDKDRWKEDRRQRKEIANRKMRRETATAWRNGGPFLLHCYYMYSGVRSEKMERWVMLRKGADFAGIGKKFQISPRLACLIRNRDVVGEEAIGQYLNGTIGDLCDGMLMKDMDKAVEILREKLEEGKRLRVIGDYDIDGVNATYILLEGLKRLGADADYDIPDRMTDGYGLNIHLVQRAYDDGVDTVLTCDNGIAAAEEIAFGKDMGMTVIVTDHHEVPFEEWGGKKQYLLPPADAVVDPKRPDCEYPFPHLCGAAVAYKLMEALWESMGRDSEDLDDLIENVAIATVGDVMDLKGENRIFVKEGLQVLEPYQKSGAPVADRMYRPCG